MSAELSFVHCGVASRHQTTEETAETGETTNNALIVVAKNVGVHKCVGCQKGQKTSMKVNQKKKAPHLPTKNLPMNL